MRTCELCGKTSRMAGTRKLLRGHYNPTNWSRKYPNLQKAVTPDGRKVLACTQCIRGFGKTDRIAQKRLEKQQAAERKAAAPARPAKKAPTAAKKKPTKKSA